MLVADASSRPPTEPHVERSEGVSILLVEDDGDYARLVRNMLEAGSGTDFDIAHVHRISDARRCLSESSVACVLLDLSLPDASRLEGLAELQAAAPEVPLVILSGTEDELLSLKAVQAGAQDYLLKADVNPQVLGRAIAYAIERKRTELELAHQAMHDPLTGLPNRALLLDRLGQALSRARRHGVPFALFFMDLNGFKPINDTLGHGVGDQLLVGVADRLRDVLRESDTAARFGGDEFTLLCENISDERNAVELVKRILNSVETPFVLGNEKLSITASIGIAIGGAGPDDTAEALIHAADEAMYRAKRRGTYYELFDEGMRARLAERTHAEKALRAAIDREEFQLLYQPQMDIQTGAVVGVEALLRWDHPDHGLIGPDAFLPLAEQTGMIVPIGRWVLREACRQQARWRRQRPDERTPRFAVNLSGAELEQPDLVGCVEKTLVETGAEPGSLCFEITERAVMEDDGPMREVVDGLKALGASVAVDDFGTGYASLITLKRFAIDVLKVDRAFVTGLGHDESDRAIVESLINLGHQLGMTVVAEGIETADQLAELRGLNCDIAQGYYLSRPRPAESIR
jgi:diguanylate cyclase (GGDEF)-like protein